MRTDVVKFRCNKHPHKHLSTPIRTLRGICVLMYENILVLHFQLFDANFRCRMVTMWVFQFAACENLSSQDFAHTKDFAPLIVNKFKVSINTYAHLKWVFESWESITKVPLHVTARLYSPMCKCISNWFHVSLHIKVLLNV